jgi:hypothetical protein
MLSLMVFPAMMIVARVTITVVDRYYSIRESKVFPSMPRIIVPQFAYQQ